MSADLITVSIGNTHTTALGWSSDGEAGTLEKWTSDFRAMEAVAKYAAAAKVVLLASVVKSCSNKLSHDLAVLGLKTQGFRTDIVPRIEIVPQPPERVGDDRIAACLGALALDPACPWVVVDAGTAVTCNAVTPASGERPPRFEGGLIVPGAALCLSALNQGTAQLPALKSGASANAAFEYIGRSTEESMLFGVLAMQSAGIAAMIHGQRAALGGSAKVAFTGGGAATLIEGLKRAGGLSFEFVHQPELVHRGLFAAWKARPA